MSMEIKNVGNPAKRILYDFPELSSNFLAPCSAGCGSLVDLNHSHGHLGEVCARLHIRNQSPDRPPKHAIPAERVFRINIGLEYQKRQLLMKKKRRGVSPKLPSVATKRFDSGSRSSSNAGLAGKNLVPTYPSQSSPVKTRLSLPSESESRISKATLSTSPSSCLKRKNCNKKPRLSSSRSVPVFSSEVPINTDDNFTSRNSTYETPTEVASGLIKNTDSVFVKLECNSSVSTQQLSSNAINERIGAEIRTSVNNVNPVNSDGVYGVSKKLFDLSEPVLLNLRQQMCVRALRALGCFNCSIYNNDSVSLLADRNSQFSSEHLLRLDSVNRRGYLDEWDLGDLAPQQSSTNTNSTSNDLGYQVHYDYNSAERMPIQSHKVDDYQLYLYHDNNIPQTHSKASVCNPISDSSPAIVGLKPPHLRHSGVRLNDNNVTSILFNQNSGIVGDSRSVSMLINQSNNHCGTVALRSTSNLSAHTSTQSAFKTPCVLPLSNMNTCAAQGGGTVGLSSSVRRAGIIGCVTKAPTMSEDSSRNGIIMKANNRAPVPFIPTASTRLCHQKVGIRPVSPFHVTSINANASSLQNASRTRMRLSNSDDATILLRPDFVSKNS